MKRLLYLVRHADSRWSEEIQGDFNRILTEEGEQNAAVIAERLLEKNVKPDLILTSPAVRAKATAEILCKELGLDEDDVLDIHPRIYEATGRILQDIINLQLDDVEQLMLVGHNPAISRVVEHFTGHLLENIPPAGAVGVAFETDTWAEVGHASGEFLWYDYPHNTIHRTQSIA